MVSKRRKKNKVNDSTMQTATPEGGTIYNSTFSLSILKSFNTMEITLSKNDSKDLIMWFF